MQLPPCNALLLRVLHCLLLQTQVEQRGRASKLSQCGCWRRGVRFQGEVHLVGALRISCHRPVTGCQAKDRFLLDVPSYPVSTKATLPTRDSSAPAPPLCCWELFLRTRCLSPMSSTVLPVQSRIVCRALLLWGCHWLCPVQSLSLQLPNPHRTSLYLFSQCCPRCQSCTMALLPTPLR